MASLRDLKKKLLDYYNPTANNGNNYWNSKPADLLVKAQKARDSMIRAKPVVAYNKQIDRAVNYLRPLEEKTTRKLIGQPIEAIAMRAMSPERLSTYKPVAITKPTLKGQLKDVASGAKNTALTAMAFTPKGISSLAGLTALDAVTTAPFNVGQDIANSFIYKKPTLAATKANMGRIVGTIPENIPRAGLYSVTNPLSDKILQKAGVANRYVRAGGAGAANIIEDFITEDKPTLTSVTAGFGLPFLLDAFVGKGAGDIAKTELPKVDVPTKEPKAMKNKLADMADKPQTSKQLTDIYNQSQLPKTEALKVEAITSVNPTGGVLVDYTPQARMKAPLGENMTTLANSMKKDPDTLITVYRGAPKTQKGINPGDFISTDYNSALSYSGEGNVLSKKVKLGDILDDLDEPLGGDYIYRPGANKELSGRVRDITKSEWYKNYSDYLNKNIQKYPTLQSWLDDMKASSKPKSQLTDIYNQAKGVTDKLPKTVPNPRSFPDTQELTVQRTATPKLPVLETEYRASQVDSLDNIIPNKKANFLNKVLGYDQTPPEGGTKEANLYTKTLRSGQEAISRRVETALGSDNKLIRNAASTMQGFFRGVGMSPERATASTELKGGISAGTQTAYDVGTSIDNIIGNSKVSKERINAVLDPDIAKTKVSYQDLTDAEKEAHDLIREGFDLVHELSYQNGFISKELYLKNKGKYVPRLYDVMETPPEVNKFVNQGQKIDNSLYKSRKNLDQWKIENSLNDPVYGLSKRLAQLETNMAVKKYTDFLSMSQKYVSDTPKPGFTKLSESPAYGKLSGKYVLNSAAEDLKGFFFSSNGMQNLYDAFRAYDRLPLRQLQKRVLTVYNPTTNVGNIVSDQVFGFVTGVDPYSLNKNLVFFKNNPAEYKRLSGYLRKQNIVGTDITKTDFINKIGQIDALVEDTSKFKSLKSVDQKVQAFYGGTDDVYKTSAFKALLDKGYSLEEATRKVADGFQNYSNVGKFYDVFAKTPIVGKPFIKFQGDLIRIIKNGAVNNPLGLITFLATLKAVAYLFSKASGETDEDRKTREERFGAPTIPGLNIPLTWQTPFGEINVARYISPFYANNDVTNIPSNMLPFVPDINTKKDAATNIAYNINDPLVAPLAQALINRDFRGKPISDPEENKFKPSTLTTGEKAWNIAKFIGRGYTPPVLNSLIDVGSVARGGKDMYGRTQTVPQAIARVGGIKITQFGAKEAEEQRNKDFEYAASSKKYNKTHIDSVNKQLLNGEITPEQAQKRIKNLAKNTIEVSNAMEGDNIIESNGKFLYLDNNGDLVRAASREKAEEGIAKMKFDESGKSSEVWNDVVFRRNENGSITTTSKLDYDYQLNTAKMSKLKKADDIKGWMALAEKQLSIIEKQLEDPSIDELEKITLENRAETLIEQIKKYSKKKGVRVSRPSINAGASYRYKKPSPAKIPNISIKGLDTKSLKLTAGDILNQPKKTLIATKKYAPARIKGFRNDLA